MTSIVVAADSLVTIDGVPRGITHKLIPLGKSGVCFIGGYSALPGVNLEETIRNWISENPTVALPKAQESLDAKLSTLMKDVRRKHPEWHPQPKEPFSYFMCFGYYRDLPYLYQSSYTATPDDITSTSTHNQLKPPGFGTEGWGNVCTEITKGNATAKFSLLKRDPAVIKYRKAAVSGKCSSISTDDLLRLSRICLEATESDEGRAFDPNAQGVGPPNYYAVIDKRQGLKWVDPPAPLELPRARKLPPSK